MAGARGAKNYKKEALLNVVKEILPAEAYAWEQVANLYKESSGENNVSDKDDVKHNWMEKLCNKFKKPTGRRGGKRILLGVSVRGSQDPQEVGVYSDGGTVQRRGSG